MRSLLLRVAVLLAATLPLTGCATKTIKTDLVTLDRVEVVPGTCTYFYTDKTKKEYNAPKESTWVFKDHQFSAAQIGLFPKEIELGWDFWGPELIRPMVEVRVFYVGDIGGVVGADEYGVHAGGDWLYKDISLGINVGRPWLDASKVILGVKVGLPVRLQF